MRHYLSQTFGRLPLGLVAMLSLLVASPASAKRVNEAGVKITLLLVEGEHSKDSNSQTYTVSVQADQVTFDGPHPPCARGRFAHSKVTFALDAKTYAGVLAAIKNGGLTKPIAEKRSTATLGNYVRVTLDVTLDGKRVRTRIQGMVSVHGSKVATISPAAKERGGAVNALLWPLRHAARPHLPGK